MKKFRFILLTVLLLLLFSACDGSDKKMKGFTYEEAAEYLASIENLEVVTSLNVYEIPCTETPVYIHKGKYVGGNNDQICLEDIFSVKTIEEHIQSDSTYEYVETYSVIRNVMEENNLYIGARPKYAAYFLEAYGFESSPDWTEWVQYNIPSQLSNKEIPPHGQFNEAWYNPLTGNFEDVVYACEKENCTEVYIIYQDICLFDGSGSPYLISKELGDQIEAEFEDIMQHKMLGTISEFSKWFMGEYSEEIPAAFSEIDGYVYYGNARNNYFHFQYNNAKKFLDSVYNDPTTYYEDMKNIGVNFDELRVYIIKATVPHNGTVQDIFWELIG